MIHFHYGPSVPLPQLPTPPRGDAVEVVFRREQPNSTGGTFTRVPANFTGATLDEALATMKKLNESERQGIREALAAKTFDEALNLTPESVWDRLFEICGGNEPLEDYPMNGKPLSAEARAKLDAEAEAEWVATHPQKAP